MKKFFVAIICGLLLIGASTALHAQPINVSGTMESELLKLILTHNGYTISFLDTWTGDLAGHGHTHVFSSGQMNGQTGETNDIVSREYLVTPDGNLFFDGLGNTVGLNLHLVMTVNHGTGIYKNATGQLVADGMISVDNEGNPASVLLYYSGTITLAD